MQQDDNNLPAALPTEHTPRPPVRREGHDERRLAVAHSQTVPTTNRPGEAAESQDGIDLLAYWQLLVKRRWLILAVIAAVLAVTLVKTILTPPVFRATSVLQIDISSIQVMEVQGISPMQGVYDPDFNQTQYELLKSQALSERVADDLKLADSDIPRKLQAPSWFQRLRNLIGLGGGVPTQRPAVPSADPVESGAQKLRAATGLVQSGLTIEPVRNSHLVRINYDSTVPAFSARVANAVADGFIASSMDRQFGASSYAKKYLEDQLAQLKSRVEDSERALVQFAQKENIVATNNGTSLVAQNLIDLNTALAKAQDQRIRAEARWNQAKAIIGGALPTDMLDNPVLRALQQQRAQLEADYQDKLRTFKPGYPAMLASKSQIDEVQKQIEQEIGSIKASVKAEFDATAAQERMLMAQLTSLRAQSLENDGRSIQYNILKRDADTNLQLYNALLQRYKEVGMAGGVKPSNISVIDRAEVPSGAFAPSLSRNMEIGLLLGMMLGIIAALLVDYLDDTLKSPTDVEALLHLPVLGLVPKLVKVTPSEARQDPRSGFSESYRSARTALQFSTDRGIPKVLLLTSSGAGEGKSTSALTLAISFAQLGKRVLLIEGDLRFPSLGKTLKMAPPAGLSSLLTGAATFAQTIVNAGDERIDMIFAGPLPPSPTELLAAPKLISLLMTAAEKYDQVIIDGPPVLGIADAPILANAAMGTLFIVKSGATRGANAKSAVKRLRGTRARLIGCLITQHDAKVSGYGYYHYENYYAYGGKPRLTNGKK